MFILTLYLRNPFLVFIIFNRIRAELQTDTTSTDKTLPKLRPKKKYAFSTAWGYFGASNVAYFFKTAIGFFGISTGSNFCPTLIFNEI